MRQGSSDAGLAAVMFVGSVLIVVATVIGLWIARPWQSQEQKACVAGYQSERAHEVGFPQATVYEYCRALYG